MNRFGQLVIPHINTEDAHDMDPESAAGIGWKECKKEVLRLLQEPLHNLDLSVDYCDERFIKRIEEL